MADTLTVVSVDIIRLRDGVQSFETGFVPKLVDLNATLHNDSSSRTLYVSKLLGGFEYDETSKRLNITFREPDPAVTYRTSPFTPPLQESLAPNETKTFEFTVPLTIRGISGFGRSSPGVKKIDASDLKEVAATFTYGTAPLRRRSRRSQAKLRTATRIGAVVQKQPPQIEPSDGTQC